MTLDYGVFPPRTSLKPQITVRKPIKSLVLSPTLLQIYCIGLIIHLFWVWAEICYPTVSNVYFYIYIYIYKE